MKNFHDDFDSVLQKVQNRDCFSFSKYADGEYKILRNEKITNCDNWTFDPDKHKEEHQYLLDSFRYDSDDYWVGISCSCCQPINHCRWMQSQVKTPNLTWANLFVNSNYPNFVKKMFKEFHEWEGRTVLLANEKGKNNKLPFNIDLYIPCNGEAFLMPYLLQHLTDMTMLACQEDKQLFLFSAGPLGNILAHRLHLANPNNTYIDIGSTINPWTVGANRGYLTRHPATLKQCVWC